jgi:hypothetical protein
VACKFGKDQGVGQSSRSAEAKDTNLCITFVQLQDAQFLAHHIEILPVKVSEKKKNYFLYRMINDGFKNKVS